MLDFIDGLVLTVLDFQMLTVAGERAMGHFKRTARGDVRSMDDLERLLDRFADDQPGNTLLAQQLWGYRLWTRAHMLRNLTHYFAARAIRTQAALCERAAASEYARDFAGQVRGLGPAVYNWLVMRFVSTGVGRPVSADDAVNTLRVIARQLALKTDELDWSIWEHQRRLPAQ